MNAIPLSAPAYASAAELSSLPGPLTTLRYAIVDSIGLFKWYLGDTTTADNLTVIAPSGGAVGRWKLSASWPGSSALIRVDVIATSNLTLSGIQTIDGVAGAAGMVVLPTAQTSGAENVPWVMASGAWTRPTWYNTDAEALPGQIVSVQRGTNNGGTLWRMSSPTSGSITLGTTSVSWERIVDSATMATESFSRVVTIDRDAVQIVGAGDLDSEGALQLIPAASGHVAGRTKIIIIPANRLASSSMFRYGADWDPQSKWDTITVSGAYVVIATASSSAELLASGNAIGNRTTTAPTISGVTLDGATPGSLVATHSTPTYYPNTTGLSLAGTASTISSITSGNGTTAVTFALSAPFVGTESASFVVGASRTAYNMSSNTALLATSTTGITLSGFDYDWSAVANLSLWLRGDSGIGVADGAAMSSGWTGKNPPAAYVFSEATNRPAYRATGTNGYPSADFDGANDLLTSAAMTVTNMLGAASSAFFVAAALKLDAIDSTGGPTYDNDAVFSDPTGYVGLHLTFHAGVYKVIAYVFDGSTKYAEYSLGALPSTVVVHMRLSGGLLYAGANGTEGTGVACGAVSASADALLVQLGKASTAKYLDGQIAELVAVKSGTLQSAGITAMVSKYT